MINLEIITITLINYSKYQNRVNFYNIFYTEENQPIPHNIKELLKATIMNVIANRENHLIKAVSHFQVRI